MEDQAHKDFSARLGQAMDERGLRQADLVRMAAADGVKLGKSQLSQYLSGKTEPRKATLAFLATALGVALGRDRCRRAAGNATKGNSLCLIHPHQEEGIHHASSPVQEVIQAR